MDKMRLAKSKGYGWLITLPLAIGLALRMLNLGGRNTWYDEVGSILFAEKSLGAIVQTTAADTMPPLYYFMLHYCLTLGNSLWVARSLSVALDTGIIAVTFIVARRLFGTRVAVFASLLVAVNPFQVYHGQEARMYSLLGLSQLLALYFFLRCIDEGGLRNWFGFVLSNAVAMYTHNAAFLWLLSIDILAFGFGLLCAFTRAQKTLSHVQTGLKQEKLGWGRLGYKPLLFMKELLVANVAVVVIFFPWLVFLPGQLAKVTRAFWIEPPGVAEFVRAIMVFTFNLPAPAPWALPALLTVSLLLFALVVYSTAVALRRNENSFSTVLVASLFLGPIGFAALISLVRPIFVERVLIASSVIYLILVAWTAGRLRPRAVAFVLLLPAMLLTIWSLSSYYQYDAFPRVSFPTVVSYLESNVSSGDVILHDNKLTFFPGYYLNRGLPQLFLSDPEWSINDTFARKTQEALGLSPVTISEAVSGKRRVYFVIFRQALEQAEEQGRRQENKTWLDEHLRLTGEKTISDIIVYVYE